MLSIADDEAEIVRLIASKPHLCKVLLKTADDPILLPIWLDHYLKLFDPEQIVIADNGSSDPVVAAIYENLPPGLTLFSYANGAGYHNNIHDRAQFAGLYAAFGASCRYLLSVDTDELLYIADDSAWSVDRGQLAALLAQARGQAVSTTWPHTARRSLDTFYVGPDPARLAWDLRWGKPFVPSTFAQGGVVIHNTQFPAPMFDPDLGANLFLMHLISYSKEQRLRVNKRKLIGRGAARPDDTFETIVARDYEKFWDPTIPRLVGEIAALLKETWAAAAAATLEKVCARFAPGGRVDYGSAEAAQAMADFRAGFPRYFAAIHEPAG